MPGADEIAVGWWPADRSAELRAFIDAEWRAGHVLARDERLLRWQHPRPAGELSVAAATAGGDLVGILGAIPVDVCVHGDRVDGAWLTTWVVREDARTGGAGLRLLDFVLARHAFAGTIGGNATTMRILGALRFRLVEAVPRWVRPLDGESLRRLVGAEALPGAPLAPGAVEARPWGADTAERWDACWRRLAPGLVGTWRDAAYVEWRYASHPTFDYRVRVAVVDGEAAALVVSRLEQVDGLDVTVLRVLEALGDEDAVAGLLEEALAAGLDAGAAFADFSCTSPRPAGALARAGFRRDGEAGAPFPSRFHPLEPEPRPLTAAYRLRGAADGDPFDGEAPYFTRSDCDQDRPA